jgi:hypothetical protein
MDDTLVGTWNRRRFRRWALHGVGPTWITRLTLRSWGWYSAVTLVSAALTGGILYLLGLPAYAATGPAIGIGLAVLVRTVIPSSPARRAWEDQRRWLHLHDAWHGRRAQRQPLIVQMLQWARGDIRRADRQALLDRPAVPGAGSERLLPQPHLARG